MPDEMFFSADMRSLRRGRRIAPRTETCRPCLVWLKENPDSKYCGVVMDINPYGMRIRMLDQLAAGKPILVQMMRDEDFQQPLAAPVEALIVRQIEEADDMTDHGVRILQKEIRRYEPRPAPMEKRPVVSRPKTRMYTLDLTVGEPRRGRTGR